MKELTEIVELYEKLYNRYAQTEKINASDLLILQGKIIKMLTDLHSKCQ